MTGTVIYVTRPSLRKEYVVTFGCGMALLLLRYLTGIDSPVSAVLLMALVAISAYLVFSLARVSSTLYRITDQCVEVIEGMSARRLKRAPWPKIADFSSKQTFLESAIGVVNISLNTPGPDRWEIELKRLRRSDAIKVLALLTEYVPNAAGASDGVTAE